MKNTIEKEEIAQDLIDSIIESCEITGVKSELLSNAEITMNVDKYKSAIERLAGLLK